MTTNAPKKIVRAATRLLASDQPRKTTLPATLQKPITPPIETIENDARRLVEQLRLVTGAGMRALVEGNRNRGPRNSPLFYALSDAYQAARQFGVELERATTILRASNDEGVMTTTAPKRIARAAKNLAKRKGRRVSFGPLIVEQARTAYRNEVDRIVLSLEKRFRAGEFTRQPGEALEDDSFGDRVVTHFECRVCRSFIASDSAQLVLLASRYGPAVASDEDGTPRQQAEECLSFDLLDAAEQRGFITHQGRRECWRFYPSDRRYGP